MQFKTLGAFALSCATLSCTTEVLDGSDNVSETVMTPRVVSEPENSQSKNLLSTQSQERCRDDCDQENRGLLIDDFETGGTAWSALQVHADVNLANDGFDGKAASLIAEAGKCAEATIYQSLVLPDEYGTLRFESNSQLQGDSRQNGELEVFVSSAELDAVTGLSITSLSGVEKKQLCLPEIYRGRQVMLFFRARGVGNCIDIPEVKVEVDNIWLVDSESECECSFGCEDE